MSILVMQHQMGVMADGWWGGETHKVYLCSGKQLDFNWDYLRRKLGPFTQDQVDGFNYILAACNKEGLKPQYAAYVIATAWHETANKMQPIAEYGKGRTRRYGRWFTNSKGVKYGIRNGDRSRPDYLYTDHPHLYYGRGYVQLTWLDNYIRARDELGVDFAADPDLALEPEHSANILVRGSMQGWFTGRSIPYYVIWGHYDEYVEARRVINGTDKSHKIAREAKIFLNGFILK